MSDVFISYSRKDIAFARLIREALQQSQIDTWIDWERIPIGERWWQEICEAIQNANVFMFIISQSSIGSKVCREEIDQALQNHKRIIPIVVDELKPEAIREFAPDLPQYNWIIFERDHIFRLEENPQAAADKPEDRLQALPQLPQFEQALEKLSTAIHTDWEWVKYHTRLQVDALRWEHNQQNPSYLVRGAALETAEQQLFRAAGKEPQPSELQVRYVTISRQEETQRQAEQLQLEQKSRRRQQLALWAVGIGLLVALILGAAAWGQRNQYLAETYVRSTAEANAISEANNRATAEANAIGESQARATQQVVAEQQRDIAVARQLALQSGEVDEQKMAVSLLLSAQSLRYSDTREGRNALAGILQSHPGLVKDFDSGLPDSSMQSLAVSPDGKWIAAGDGTLGCSICPILIWETATGLLIEKGFSEDAMIRGLVFSLDSQMLISKNLDGYTTVRDIETGEILWHKLTGKRNAPLALSPNGKLLATGAEGGITLWNFPDFTKFKEFPNCGGDIAFTPDSTQFVGRCGGDNSISLWDISSGEQIGESVLISNGEYQMELKTFAISPKPPYVVAVSGHTCKISYLDACSIKTWMVDLGTFTLIEGFFPFSQNVDENLHDGVGYHMAYTPNGDFLVTIAGANTAIWKISWDIEMGFSQPGAPVTQGNIWDMQIMPDGNSFITVHGTSDLRMWQIQNQSPLRQFLSHPGFDNPGYTDGALFVPGSGDTLLVADESSTLDDENNPGQAQISLWNLSKQPIEHEYLDGESFGVIQQAVSPDGKWLAIGQRNGEVSLWDLPGRSRSVTLAPAIELDDQLDHSVTGLAFSPDGRYLLIGDSRDEILRFDTENPDATPLAYPTDFPGIIYVRAVAYAANGLYIVASIMYDPDGKSSNDLIILIDAETGQVTKTISPQEGFYWCKIQIHPSGNFMALSCQEKIFFFEIPSFTPISPSIYTGKRGLSDFAFSPDGKLLATLENGVLNDSALKLWDFETKQLIVTLDGNSFGKLSFSPDGELLYAGSIFDYEGLSIWHLDAQEWAAQACAIANRNLTQEEWKYYLQDIPYEKTCPELP